MRASLSKQNNSASLLNLNIVFGYEWRLYFNDVNLNYFSLAIQTHRRVQYNKPKKGHPSVGEGIFIRASAQKSAAQSFLAIL